MNWLSHHAPQEHGRCYRAGPGCVCARCLGTYPVLFATLALQFALKAPLAHSADVAVGAALVVPATLDWAWGRSHPKSGSNLWRSATGVLLGAGLGRSLYIHLQRPFPDVLKVQIAFVTAVVLLAMVRASWPGSRP